MVLAVFMWVALLDPKAMLTAVHAVCRRWRQLCGDTQGVLFDFAFLRRNATVRFAPVDAAAEAAMVASLSRLASRFAHIVELSPVQSMSFGSVTVSEGLMNHDSADSYAIALLKRCPLLTNVNFTCCDLLTDASVVALAERCPLLTNVNFSYCDLLTDASVVALAERCLLLTVVNGDSEKGWQEWPFDIQREAT